jgi:2'-5' RNA ligase
VRLFVAFELPAAVRAAIGRRLDELRGGLPRARWVRPESMHLTLKFLGEVDEAEVPGLGAELGPLCAAAAPMTARVDGAGCFPPARPARIAWLGLEVEGPGGAGPGAGGLAALQAAIDRAAARLPGVERDRRPFSPHVTVARCDPPWPRPAAERFAAALGGPLGEPFALDRAALVASRLGPGGARYSAVGTYPLGGG